MTDKPTVAEVCVLEGPGWGQCWACPVLACPLWVDPTNPFTPELATAATGAALRVYENRTVIDGQGGRALVERTQTEGDETVLTAFARELVEATLDPAVQARLRIRMAAEAVVQGRLEGRISTEEDSVYRDWIKQVGHHTPTASESEALDIQLENLQADVAARVYGITDVMAVRAELADLRGRPLRVTAQYRSDHGA